MLCRQPQPPIKTYKDFFRACRKLKRYGFAFAFTETCVKARCDNGRAYAHAIWWTTPSHGYCNPIEVIHHVFYGTSTKVWRLGTLTRKDVGLSVKKYNELQLAWREAPGHLLTLRARMVAALDLVEVPINERQSFKRKRRRKKDDH